VYGEWAIDLSATASTATRVTLEPVLPPGPLLVVAGQGLVLKKCRLGEPWATALPPGANGTTLALLLHDYVEHYCLVPHPMAVLGRKRM
jgi:hypothetical protein